jgi:bifunctional non-homologous end joining protein LigD
VSTPVTWPEVEDAVDAGQPARLAFGMAQVLERVAEHGDLFEPVLSLRQDLRGRLRASASALGAAARATD